MPARTAGRPSGARPGPAQPSATARLSAAAPGLARRRRPLRLGDSGGLTALGGVVLVLIVGGAAGAWDLATGPGLGLIFAAGFVAGCVLAALSVHREDLRAAVVMPPLLYLVLSVTAGAVRPSSGAGGGWLTRQVTELASALVYDAPVLYLATGLALVVAVARWLGDRR